MPLVALPEILPDLIVRHTERHPVFVVGAARSGTSLTAALLRKYLKVNFGTESQFLIDYHRRIHRYGDLDDEANLRLLIRDIAAERCFARLNQRFGFRLDAGRVVRDARERTYPAVVEAMFRQYAAYHQMERWGDKTPAYISHLPVLLELFPHARFLHIVRDGRDVALSGYREFFAPKNAYMAARLWRSHILSVRRFAATLPPDRCLQLRYEDVMSSPVESFARLIAFLRIDDGDGSLLRFIASRISGDLRESNTYKWRAAFSPREHEIFEAVAGETLESLGYECVSPQRIRLTSGARAYYHADERVRKWLDIDYQRDNVYRLKLRLRWATQRIRRVRLAWQEASFS